jgi:hypothetical protein
MAHIYISNLPAEAASWLPVIYFNDGSMEYPSDTLAPDESYFTVLGNGVFDMSFAIFSDPPGSSLDLTELEHRNVRVNIAYGENFYYNWTGGSITPGKILIAGSAIVLGYLAWKYLPQ